LKNLFLILFILPTLAFAQSAHLPLNLQHLGRMEKQVYRKGFDQHPASKPYILGFNFSQAILDSTNEALRINTSNAILNGTLNEHFINTSGPGFSFTVDPVIDAVYFKEFSNPALLYDAGYGANINSSLKEKLHFNLFLSGGYTRLPSYLDSITRAEEVVPGRAYAFAGSDGGFRYRNNSGYLSYTPSKYFNFTGGFGRNFIGDGYRSLLLSDHAYNYPYAKITTKIWKIQYTNLFTNFKDISLSGGDMRNAYNKYGAFHFLSWNVTKRLNIGLFEGIIFENRDTTGRRFTYDVNYLNPIIFYRPVEYSIGSADNALMGLNFNYKLFNNQVFYGQAMIDEFLLEAIRADVLQAVAYDPNRVSGWWANKYGFQAGFKWFDFLWIKNLNLQAEHNLVRPYSYTHSSIRQNYAHFNQPLAHPLGANFSESLMILRYYYKRFSAETRFVYAELGDDTETVHFGRSLYRSYTERPYEYGHTLGQGVDTKILTTELRLFYLINPKYNLNFEVGVTHRDIIRNGVSQPAQFVFAGISTGIFNRYTDR
jgi:hypothetical protein